ncbi:MAG: hypothetical protein ACI9BW_004352, partial [Gammaproteobacteria bacterium]
NRYNAMSSDVSICRLDTWRGEGLQKIKRLRN